MTTSAEPIHRNYYDHYNAMQNVMENETNENILKYCTAAIIGEHHHIENRVAELWKDEKAMFEEKANITEYFKIAFDNKGDKTLPEIYFESPDSMREMECLILTHEYITEKSPDSVRRVYLFKMFLKACKKGLEILARDSICSNDCILHNEIPKHIPKSLEQNHMMCWKELCPIFDTACKMKFAHPTSMFYDLRLRLKSFEEHLTLEDTLTHLSRSNAFTKHDFVVCRNTKEEKLRNNRRCFDTFFHNEKLPCNRKSLVRHCFTPSLFSCLSENDYEHICSTIVYLHNKTSTWDKTSDLDTWFLVQYIPTLWSFAKKELRNIEVPDSTIEEKIELLQYISKENASCVLFFGQYGTILGENFLIDMIGTLTNDNWLAKWTVSLWKNLQCFQGRDDVIRAKERFVKLYQGEAARYSKLKLNEEKRNRLSDWAKVLEAKKPIALSALEVVSKDVVVENGGKAMVICTLCSRRIENGCVKAKCIGKCSFSLHYDCWTNFLQNRTSDVKCLNCKSKLCSWRYGVKTSTLSITPTIKQDKVLCKEIVIEKEEQKFIPLPVYKGESYRQNSTKEYEELSKESSLTRNEKKLKQKLKRQRKQQKYEEGKQFNELRLNEERDEVIEYDPPMILNFDRIIPDAVVVEKPTVVESKLKQYNIYCTPFIPTFASINRCSKCSMKQACHINYPCGHTTLCDNCYRPNAMCTVCFGTIL